MTPKDSAAMSALTEKLRAANEAKALRRDGEEKVGPTPGPWEANLDSDHGDYIIWGPGLHEFIANIGTEGTIAFDVAEANARFIVRACNAHEALVEALRTSLETIKYLHGDTAWDLYVKNAPEMKAIDAALALAGSKP